MILKPPYFHTNTAFYTPLFYSLNTIISFHIYVIFDSLFHQIPLEIHNKYNEILSQVQNTSKNYSFSVHQMVSRLVYQIYVLPDLLTSCFGLPDLCSYHMQGTLVRILSLFIIYFHPLLTYVFFLFFVLLCFVFGGGMG